VEEEKRYREFGKEILTGFWNVHRPDFRLPIALEKGFNLDVDGIKVRGYVDRVDKLQTGGLSVVDYKSNKELFTSDYLAEDLQLTIYQAAAEQMWRLPVERLTLYHLRSNTACSCAPRTRGQIDAMRRLVLDVAEGITQAKFPATENNFCPCDFPEYCPFQKHKFMAGNPLNPGQGMLPGIIAAEAVEHYADLQARVKELQEQLDAAKKTIIDFCQSQEINRVYGGEHEITYKLVERAGFSEDEVKAVLEPLGLWDKVVGLDQSRLKLLLADEDVSSEIKRKIESLRRIASAYPQIWLKESPGEED
jgi:putative RecB family exonuclease